jgi:[protein-PII] uridylyltransferase
MTVGTAAYAQARADLLARPGITGPGRRRALAELTDGWLSGLLAAAVEESAPRAAAGGVALVAVGGYGRGELSPGSDLDVVLLRATSVPLETAAAVADRVWYPVWDSGVRLDHSLRTVPEARRVASEDLRALLGLLDLRHVAGDEELTEGLRQTVLTDWRAFAATRLPELHASCRDRAERSGDLAFSLEPDLKESRGGLRDLAALRAVAASWVADAPHEGLDEAGRALLDVRDALHTVTGRASDRLVLQEQDAVAHELGLLDGDVLLRRVSGLGRTVAYAADVTWHRVERALVSRRPRTRFGRLAGRRLTVGAAPGERRPLAEGVVEQDGEAVLARDARPWEDPVLPLRAAAAAAQAGLRLAPHTVERLAAEGAVLPEPWPQPARDALVSLLGAGPPAVPVWEALDQAGLTCRLLPDWERVRSRPQHNPVHRFTVDRHLVETAVRAGALTRRVDRPDLLLLGGLLHDIGKGWPGDHSEAGVAVVAELGPRLGLPPTDVEVLVTLVRHHLLLPDTATRRDLEDPATVAQVAACVRTPEVLDLLHALSEADGQATGPLAWNDWKAGLVDELVARTHAVLRGHAVPPPPALTDEQQRLVALGGLSVAIEARPFGVDVTVVAPDRVGLLATVAGVLSLNRLAVRSASTQTVGASALQVWSVVPEFGDPPALDRLRDDVRRALDGSLDVAQRLARREESYLPSGATVPPARVDVVPAASATATVLEVRAHDRPGLLHRIGTALAGEGVDVRSALVSTLGSEAVDVFYVVGRDGHQLPAIGAEQAAAAVRGALAG